MVQKNGKTVHSGPQATTTTTSRMMLRRYLKRSLKRLAVCTVVLILTAGLMLIALDRSGYRGNINRYLLAFINAPAKHSGGPRIYRYENTNATLVIRNSQHFSLYVDRVDSLSDASVRILYHQQGSSYLEITAECSPQAALMKTNSSDWNLCAADPFALRTPACLVFSFGHRAASWQFEGNLVDRYKCQVFAFDPYMPPKYQIEDENPYCLREGLKSDTHEASWFTESYSSHLKRLKCQDLAIDVLKLDIGLSAWPALETAARDQSLENVKQLLLSTPTGQNVSLEEMKRQISVLAELHRIGFRLWRQTFLPSLVDRGRYNRRLHFFNSKFASQSTSDRSEMRSTFASQLPDPLASLSVVKLPGYEEFNRVRHQNQLPPANHHDAGAAFRQLTRQPHFHCPNSRNIGESDVCITGPFDIRLRHPCIVVSFGLQKRRKLDFEEKLAGGYKCAVHAVDREVAVRKQTASNAVRFHRAGLSPNGDSFEKLSGLSLLTLCSLLRDLGYSAPKEIDILKIDWNSGDEWLILGRALKDGCLSRVRQIIIRTSSTIGGGQLPETYYDAALRVLARIYDQGFANWNQPLVKTTVTTTTTGESAGGGSSESQSSSILYLININLPHL